MKALMMHFMLFAATLTAADVTGTWKAALKGQAGTMKRTFVFNQDGTKLTGKTTSDRWGKSEIKNGKIEGDNLSFTITLAFEFGAVEVSVTGKVQGNAIAMVAALQGSTVEFTAQRTP